MCPSYNVGLSKRRAASVVKELTQRRAKNRRVELMKQ
jgi:outer membrane protein OmpA-like peptidoglycan-associated protein